MQRRGLLAAMRVVAQLLALSFVVWTALKVAHEWNGLPAGVPVSSIVWAGLASLAANFIQAYAWQVQIEFLSGRELPWPVQLRVFMASNLGRYMPGKVGLPALRIAGLAALGLSPALVGSGVLLEAFCWLATAGLFSFALLSFAPNMPLPPPLDRVFAAVPVLAPLLLVSLGLVVLALVLLDRKRLPAGLLRLSGLGGEGPLAAARLPLGQLVYWGAWWCHGFCLVTGFGVARADAAFAATAFVVAPAVGFLALVAPAGAGVREAVVIALVSPFTGISSSVAIGILSRLLSLAGDVVSWLIALALERRYARSE